MFQLNAARRDIKTQSTREYLTLQNLHERRCVVNLAAQVIAGRPLHTVCLVFK